MMKINKDGKINITNLKALQKVLEEKAGKVNMACFYSVNGIIRTYKPIKANECNTACCAVGYGVMYGIGVDVYETKSVYEVGGNFDYLKYSEDHLVTEDASFKGGDGHNHSVWDFLFDANWHNSKEQAIGRLEIVIGGHYELIRTSGGEIDFTAKYTK